MDVMLAVWVKELNTKVWVQAYNIVGSGIHLYELVIHQRHMWNSNDFTCEPVKTIEPPVFISEIQVVVLLIGKLSHFLPR